MPPPAQFTGVGTVYNPNIYNTVTSAVMAPVIPPGPYMVEQGGAYYYYYGAPVYQSTPNEPAKNQQKRGPYKKNQQIQPQPQAQVPQQARQKPFKPEFENKNKASSYSKTWVRKTDEPVTTTTTTTTSTQEKDKQVTDNNSDTLNSAPESTLPVATPTTNLDTNSNNNGITTTSENGDIKNST